jgi:uncharacterized protein (DUF1501 family)
MKSNRGTIMQPIRPVGLSRRSFLKGALSSTTLVSLAGTVPQFLLTASTKAAESNGQTILIVLQLSGGNDGLNTVIPYSDDVYKKGRPSLAIGADRIRKVDSYIGLHPSMEGFSKLLEDHRLGIVQGVGYPTPDRSHFSSMDIWQSARRDTGGSGDGAFASNAGHRATGWLGRLLDSQSDAGGASGDLPAVQLSSGAARLPLALVGEHAHVTSIQSPEAFKLDDGGDTRVARAIQQATEATRAGNDDLVTFLQDGARAALRSSKQVQESLNRYKTDVKYPETNLARRLKTIAQLIDAGLATRIYYLDLDGFDTHASQAASHANLLGELSGAVTAFTRDLDQHGHGQRAMLMTFSEFGRRLRENASQGTDHGAAAPMFLAGGKVKPGLLGKYPSLTDLDEGDLKFTTDFRSVYAAVLEQWLGVAAEPILGGRFAPISLTA